MITLAIFRQMVADGVADLEKDKNFFWEEAPLQHDGKPAKGVWLVTRGGDISNSRKGLNMRTTVDFYIAFGNKAKAEATYMAIQEWLRGHKVICGLAGEVDKYTYAFRNIRIRPSQSPQNAGATENGLIVKVASILVIYDESQERNNND